MDSTYLFSILAPHNRVQALGNSFDGPDYFVIKHEEDERPPVYSFGSPHLNALEDPSEIWARGTALKALVNGALNLEVNPMNFYYSRANLIEFFNLFIAAEDRDITPRDYHDIPQSNPFCQVYSQMPISPITKPVGKRAKVIYEARSNEKIRTLLLQLGNGLDWINLYSILDTIQTFCKQVGRNEFVVLRNKCGLSKEDVRAFTGTVNNYGVLGVSARHGILENHDVPQRTATLSESQLIVLRLANAYFEHYHNIG